ncbi:hypothetical protein [Nocardia jiangsuensis]|uniref:Uncharacterized protein n=1 Tax=Nocardia jiangsuensis TaxID=1691563 RepID=A0ABV8DQC0_9NOCA
MRSARPVLAVLATAVLATAALVVFATPAVANPATTGGPFTPAVSLTDGLCVAYVDTAVTGDAYPEHAAFTVAATLVGVGPCSLPVTLTWRNVDTGETGVVTKTARGPGYWSTSGRDALFHAGIGRFDGTVTIGPAHLPEPGTVDFTVTRYQG